jgi:hypothetical protein
MRAGLASNPVIYRLQIFLHIFSNMFLLNAVEKLMPFATTYSTSVPLVAKNVLNGRLDVRQFQKQRGMFLLQNKIGFLLRT